MECRPCEPLPTVAVIGGTHGNEIAGVNLVRRMLAAPESFERPRIRTLAVIGNPEAVKRCTRFVDCDLNRCMSPQILAGEEGPYEERRARELAAQLGSATIVLDIHNTTSNAGTMLIVGTDTDPLTLQLLAHLVEQDPSRRVWLNKTLDGTRSASNVGSVAPCDLGLEIGPQVTSTATATITATITITAHCHCRCCCLHRYCHCHCHCHCHCYYCTCYCQYCSRS